MDKLIVNNKEYQIITLLGKGKGGYSYLAEVDNQRVVLKQIHHEPCAYYQFGNKIESELNDYKRLIDAGIRIPKMLDHNIEQEIITKEYIDGKTIKELLDDNEDISSYLEQVKEMAKLAKEKNLNIDYYPTNFVVQKGVLFYIDFECNTYDEKWSFEVWGKQYWTK